MKNIAHGWPGILTDLRLRLRTWLRRGAASRHPRFRLPAVYNEPPPASDHRPDLTPRHTGGAALQAAILDAVPANIALLDHQGVILSVNAAWRRFADVNGMPRDRDFGIGSNYLEAGTCVSGDSLDESAGRFASIGQVLSGDLSGFSIEYPCHSPTEQRWFLMRVSALGDDGRSGAIVLHLDVTEKRKAEDVLRASESQLRQMAENIRDGFFLADVRNQCLLYVSPACEDLLGHRDTSLSALPGAWLAAMLPGDRTRIVAHYQAHLRSAEARFDCTFQIVRADGALRWIGVKAFSIRDESGTVTRLTGVAQDITDSHHATHALHESAFRFNDLLMHIGLMSVMLDRDAKITFCNDHFLHLTGWRHDEVIGRDWFSHFMPFDNAKARAHFAAQLDDQPGLRRYEDEIVLRSGERRLICWNNSALHASNGDVIGTASIGEDITEQRQADLKILNLNANLEKMSVQLIHAQEQERISLARELHDELGQRLALLKIDLHHLRRLLPDPDQLSVWTTIDADVATLIAQIRVISVSLRPPALDYLGLESAIRQLLARQFANSTTATIFEYAGLPATLAPSIEIAVYRIVQESITNITRHAHATRVVVEINGGESGQELELIIRDNGQGFDPAAASIDALRDGGGSGLSGMRERVALMGGSFEVDASPGNGTRISASLALRHHE